MFFVIFCIILAVVLLVFGEQIAIMFKSLGNYHVFNEGEKCFYQGRYGAVYTAVIANRASKYEYVIKLPMYDDRRFNGFSTDKFKYAKVYVYELSKGDW